jgi:hypothetical protein
LLIDEDLPNDLADELQRCSSAIKAIYVRDVAGMSGTKDNPLRAIAKMERRIILTTDSDFNHKADPPCTHDGIIRLVERRKHTSITAGIFQQFMLSGYRKHVKNSVTYLSKGKARIVSHDGEATYHF